LPEKLKEVQLEVLTKETCSLYVSDNIDQKYCTGVDNVAKDTCQVILKYL
jgi:hypothetical protein